MARVDPETIYWYLVRDHAVSDATARGILANIQHESDFDPFNATGDGGTSGGLFQHHAERWANLKAYANRTGRPWTDWRTQVDYAIKEARSYRIDLQMSDAVEASKVWTIRFERPEDPEMKAERRARHVDRYRYGGSPPEQQAEKATEDEDTLLPVHFTDGYKTPGGKGRTRKRDDVMVLQAMLGFADADIDGMYGEETVRRVKTHTGGDGKTVDGKTYIRIQREYLRSFLRAQGRTSGSEYFHPTGGIGSYGTPLKNAFGAPRPGGRKHEGQDIMLAEGKPLYAVTAGKVTWARNDSAGVIVYLHGDDGHRYSYFHLSRREGSDGMKVVANQIIGYVGDTGNSNGPHLHFGYRPDGGDYVDPRSLLDSATTS